MLNATAANFRRIDQCAFDLFKNSGVSDALWRTFEIQGIFIYHKVVPETPVWHQ